MNQKSTKQNLDHGVWEKVKSLGFVEKNILVALSGGVDSVALLLSLRKVMGSDKVAAFHFHHGPGAQSPYRDSALQFCQQLCQKHQVAFFTSRSEQELRSEQDLREARYEALRACRDSLGFEIIALAHHCDDLLETRMMRLIRGTGGQGLMAMKVWEASFFRPFLKLSKKEIVHYLEQEGEAFLEDPSNLEIDPFRNWVRHKWLPQLEQHTPGALTSLARSLETLVEELEQQPRLLFEQKNFASEGLQRSFYLSLTSSQQKMLLAQYLRALGKRNFSQSHLEEIQKRLDNPQKVITFTVAGFSWLINAEQIRVQS